MHVMMPEIRLKFPHRSTMHEGIRYMVYCRLLASGAQYDTPIPLEHEYPTNSQCSPSFSIRKGS